MTAYPATQVPDTVAATVNRPLTRPQTERFPDIDRAKGFAIALVVWGHLASVVTTNVPLWFYISISAIYSFHMPVFMYLSGFVFFLVDAPERFWRSPASQIFARFNRLMVPFLFFGFVVVVGKFFVNSAGQTVDPVGSIPEGLLKVLYNAPDNPSGSIWYLLVLFVYTIAAPILWKMGKNGLSLVILFGILGWTLDVEEIFYLHRISIYFIFFGVGGVFAIYRIYILNFIKSYNLIFILIFGIICYYYFDHKFSLLICGLPAIPAIHGLFLQEFLKNDKIFLTLGKYSMAIYLLNTIILGISGIALCLYLPDLANNFLFFIIILFFAGIFGPMIIRRGLNAIPFLKPVSRYFD